MAEDDRDQLGGAPATGRVSNVGLVGLAPDTRTQPPITYTTPAILRRRPPDSDQPDGVANETHALSKPSTYLLVAASSKPEGTANCALPDPSRETWRSAIALEVAACAWVPVSALWVFTFACEPVVDSTADAPTPCTPVVANACASIPSQMSSSDVPNGAEMTLAPTACVMPEAAAEPSRYRFASAVVRNVVPSNSPSNRTISADAGTSWSITR